MELPKDPGAPECATPTTPPTEHDLEDQSFVTGQEAEPDVPLNPTETDPEGDNEDPDEWAPDVPPNLPPGSTHADPTDDKGVHGV